MADETNSLLRQILATQQEHLAAYKKETERVADFRIAATEMQKKAARRQLFAGLIVAGAGLVMLLASILSR